MVFNRKIMTPKLSTCRMKASPRSIWSRKRSKRRLVTLLTKSSSSARTMNPRLKRCREIFKHNLWIWAPNFRKESMRMRPNLIKCKRSLYWRLKCFRKIGRPGTKFCKGIKNIALTEIRKTSSKLLRVLSRRRLKRLLLLFKVWVWLIYLRKIHSKMRKDEQRLVTFWNEKSRGEGKNWI